MSAFFPKSFLLLIGLSLIGCNSSTALVALHTTTEPRRSMSVNFSHAYFGKSANGEDQIVLLREPIDEAVQQDPDQPLVRQTAPALTQVLLIQLHWGTAPASISDSPVANNAVLHWYVYGEPGDTGMGVLHYVGNGAVSFSPDQWPAKVMIHDGDLALLDQQGPLRDPFGNFKIEATFSATSNSALMQQTIDDLNKAIAKAAKPVAQP